MWLSQKLRFTIHRQRNHITDRTTIREHHSIFIRAAKIFIRRIPWYVMFLQYPTDCRYFLIIHLSVITCQYCHNVLCFFFRHIQSHSPAFPEKCFCTENKYFLFPISFFHFCNSKCAGSHKFFFCCLNSPFTKLIHIFCHASG